MKRTCSTEDLPENTLIKKPALEVLPEGELVLSEDPISDADDDDVQASNTLNSRLGMCEVCAAHKACYTCPKCEVKTCCLNCVRIHKKELNCDGIRDRTKFIPLKQMSNMDFMSDYYFLEECTRYVDDRKKDQLKKYTRYNRDLPVHLNRLRSAAKERLVHLKFLLQNFARHKENTTYYDWRSKKIWWRIKWIFINAGNLCYTDEKCLEDSFLRDLLKKYVDRDAVDQVPEKRKLDYYQSKGVQNLKVLLKAEGIKCCKNRFYLLDVNKTLRENLQGKTLVEYPWIYISYEDDCSTFNIIDSDEDVETERKQHEANLEVYRKEQLEKRKRELEGQLEGENEDEVIKGEIEKIAKEKRKKEKQLKFQEYEEKTNNFLFTDEQLLEVLSSSSEEDE